jgi:hypothetical protein
LIPVQKVALARQKSTEPPVAGVTVAVRIEAVPAETELADRLKAVVVTVA